MAFTDKLSGVLDAVIHIKSKTANPEGVRNYRFSYDSAWFNTESAGTSDAWALHAVFQETVVVTTTDIPKIVTGKR